SKVYRYLLRNNEEQLVSLQTETDMLQSYYFLLKKRHGDALNITLDIPEKYLDAEMPPLTLQMLIENSINQNVLTRNAPLNIFITVVNEQIEITHNLQPKLYGSLESEEAIENISNKFSLLTKGNIMISEQEQKRIIRLPLLAQKEPRTA
ncbi:MAG TPA: hypothetical protein VMY77_05125, partial [Chitinophagaceae bacterium]|nr:hypothetical protein [Chitinophagaceae bacterium]